MDIIMEGKERLYNSSQEVKETINRYFNSIDDFYNYAMQLSHDQYVSYKMNGVFDNTKLEELKSFLEFAGIDLWLANELVEEVSADYEENLFINNIQPSFGDDWKEKFEEIEKTIDSLLQNY